jgi:hypothetical protein
VTSQVDTATEMDTATVVTQSEPGLLESMIRQPGECVSRMANEHERPETAKKLLAMILAGGAVFGAAIGSHHSGLQILYAAIKLPLVILLTAAVCTPVLTAMNRALGRPAELSHDLLLVLGSLARGSLVLAALAPLPLIAALMGTSYHNMILLVVGCCGLAGILGLALFVRGMWHNTRAVVFTMAALLLVFALTGTQMTWSLRPFVLRPCAKHAMFLRSLEGSFSSSVSTTMDSAQGRYRTSSCGE